ncbi:hypothetical protein SAMN05216388_10674 [Halorientalis persicus]|uniref:DUF7718 domain-containing protein n=1 Tax=Halorientalis persicus TaxID=1367881 RepID=A0A1H8WNF4_9EURY|nr:hypothetical protein [Halorientalis persicus]SEP29156.1 hypothetical protein SAMN05216388_10674 [Halorientalis persicus]
MTQSEFTYEYDAETVRDTQFLIGARHTPSTNNVESFAVILFFELSDGTRVEVAKVDNSEHDEGTIHADRYYRETGAEIKDLDVDVSDCWDAEDWLLDNAQRFCRTYLENHGKQHREDGANV